MCMPTIKDDRAAAADAATVDDDNALTGWPEKAGSRLDVLGRSASRVLQYM